MIRNVINAKYQSKKNVIHVPNLAEDCNYLKRFKYQKVCIYKEEKQNSRYVKLLQS